MPRLLLRRAGPIGLALSAYDIWKRLPPKQRRAILEQARKHGPLAAEQALRAVRAAAKATKRPR